MRRLGRGIQTLIAAFGAVVIIGLIVFAFVGVSQDGSTRQQFSDKRISQVDQDRNLAQAKREYRDYVAQTKGSRAKQANLDHPLLRQIEEASLVVGHCGAENSDYGVPNYTTCADDPELPDEVQVTVETNSYTISGSAGGAIFTLHFDSDQVAERSCDQPKAGACAPNGTWLI